MTGAAADWVSVAASLPLAFAQVREDPLLDLWVLDRLGHPARVALVASGGCTAAALAITGVEALHLVDPNPAQIAITRLKLELLRDSAPADRLRLLGHALLDPATRAARLSELLGRLGLPSDALGLPGRVAARGPDHAGRYEHLFGALRAELAEFAASIEALLQLSDPDEQARRVRPNEPLGKALDRAFAKVMALPNLVALFGEGATRNPREPFASHFARQLRWILGTRSAAGNPFLSQMLLGRFAPGAEHPWLQQPVLKSTPSLSWDASPMVPALEKHRGEFDLVHLSNILDWLDPEAARETLESAFSALRPGGWVIVRQLNSALDIPALCARIIWHRDAGSMLLERDRSFFYRAICVGERR
jgi:S-adenosylmethionine-diacylglycerol 3-amino-3-carboxypropyl transferase